MNVLAPNQATGTLYAFIQARLPALGENTEQIEAFGKELYHVIVQIVCDGYTEGRGFSMEAIRCFPVIPVDKMNIVKLYKWWMQFMIWQEELITEREKEALQNAEFIWI